MKILVVGGGGREHALVWKLANDSARPEIFCAPGNAGTSESAHNLPIAAEDAAGIMKWAAGEKPDLTVIGPEAPLCAGIVDAFNERGLRVFGPNRAAAQLEGSKVFAKELLKAAGVKTARADVFENAANARSGLSGFSMPVVIKADGLAAGKGVIICESLEQAESAIADIMEKNLFGAAGARILAEEFLRGEELSVLAFADGENFALMPAAQDHKRIFDDDQGPNTGGMGAYAPAPAATPSILEKAREQVFGPVFHELRRRNIAYKGVLYAGLMICGGQAYVLEFNCRFGDPETQAVLPLLNEDLIPLMENCIDGRLNRESLVVSNGYCVCVVMAAGGYPGKYEKGIVINGLAEASKMEGVMVFHAGTALRCGDVVTSGGRVLGVTALGRGLEEAAQAAYRGVAAISFENAHWRSDIARKGIRALGRSVQT